MHCGSRSLFDDPDLFLYRLDVARDRAWFVWMNREAYRSSTFLDSRIRRRPEGGVEARITELADAAPGAPATRRPSRFLFHIGHTCSTLLSRAIGELPGCLVLREPAVLADLARWADAGKPPRRFTEERWRAFRENVFAILAKTYEKGEKAVIKPSSLVNGVMADALVGQSSRKAVFVYSALPAFLANMLRSGDNREDGVADLAARLRRPGARFRADTLRRQPIGRKLAALWILHLDLFVDLLPHVPPSRFRSLDADAFVAAPADSLLYLARFFGFDWTQADIASVASGPIFRSNSKNAAEPYGAEARRAELGRAHETWKAEIDDALGWAARTTRNRPLPDVLPRRLGGAASA